MVVMQAAFVYDTPLDASCRLKSKYRAATRARPGSGAQVLMRAPPPASAGVLATTFQERTAMENPLWWPSCCNNHAIRYASGLDGVPLQQLVLVALGERKDDLTTG